MKHLAKLFMICFLIVNLLMFSCSIIFKTNVFYESNKIISLLGMIGIIIIWILFYKKISPLYCKQSEKRKKIFLTIYFFLFFIIEIIYLKELKVNPTWDFGVIFNNAKNFVNHIPIGYIEYFEYCPNNIFLYLFYIIILKIGTLVPFIDSLTILGIINIICIELSVFLLYKIATKVYNEYLGITVLFIALFISPLFLYTPIIYTDTTTMFIPLLLLYVYLIQKEKTEKKEWNYIILFSVIAYIGYNLKMSCLIIVIALLIHMILNKDYKLCLKYIGSLTIVFLCFSIFYKTTIINNEKFHFNDNNVGSLPFTHYIMMGLEKKETKERMTYGGYVEEDALFTKSLKPEERKKANIEEWCRRLKSYSFVELLNFYGNKIANTWGDGTYFAPIKISRNPIKKSQLQEIYLPNGKYFNIYLNFAQSIQYALLCLIGISAYKMRKDKTNTYLYLTIFGLFLFLIIWETRSRYVVNYIPLLLLVALKGLEKKDKNCV